MIMIIWLLVMIFYLMWYLINSWKLLSENPQPPPEKIHSPSKNSKSASVPPFLLTMKIFSPPSAPPPLHSRLCRVALLALLYKVLLCRLVWLTDFLEIQSPKEDVCYRRHKILDCLWAGYGLHKVYHIRYNHRKIQTRSGKK